MYPFIFINVIKENNFAEYHFQFYAKFSFANVIRFYNFFILFHFDLQIEPRTFDCFALIFSHQNQYIYPLIYSKANNFLHF